MTDTTHTGLRARIEALAFTRPRTSGEQGWNHALDRVLALLDTPPAPQETARESICQFCSDAGAYSCGCFPTPAAATTDNTALVEVPWEKFEGAVEVGTKLAFQAHDYRIERNEARVAVMTLRAENAHLRDVIREMVDCHDDATQVARTALASRPAEATSRSELGE